VEPKKKKFYIETEDKEEKKSKPKPREELENWLHVFLPVTLLRRGRRELLKESKICCFFCSFSWDFSH